MHNVGFAEAVGYVAASLVFLTFYIKTMVPLRIVAICSNCVFLTYGYLDGLHPILVLHAILLPLNVMRLCQMIRLSRSVREAAHGDLNMAWIKPFSAMRRIRAWELLFRKSDSSKDMFVIVSGRYRLEESGIELGPGNVVGELSLLAPKHRHTQTLACIESGKVLRMDLGQVEQLFFQNQKFGFCFLKLIVSRLFENLEKLERGLAEREREIQRLKSLLAESADTGRLPAVREPEQLVSH